jgi:hypothetical protein
MKSNPYTDDEPVTRKLLKTQIKEWEEILANDQDPRSQDMALLYLASLRKELEELNSQA